MKAKYVNPFLSASIGLFKDFLKFNLTYEQPYINNDPQKLHEVSAIIGLAGETTGAVVLSFTRETAIEIVSAFSGSTFNALSKEVIDGVGELVNIVAGNAKKGLENLRIEISLPGVIVGSDYKINWPKGVPVITIPFSSEAGNFSVNVSMKEY
jgi:chemotaxis protein CheX